MTGGTFGPIRGTTSDLGVAVPLSPRSIMDGSTPRGAGSQGVVNPELHSKITSCACSARLFIPPLGHSLLLLIGSLLEAQKPWVQHIQKLFVRTLTLRRFCTLRVQHVSEVESCVLSVVVERSGQERFRPGVQHIQKLFVRTLPLRSSFVR